MRIVAYQLLHLKHTMGHAQEQQRRSSALWMIVGHMGTNEVKMCMVHPLISNISLTLDEAEVSVDVKISGDVH